MERVEIDDFTEENMEQILEIMSEGDDEVADIIKDLADEDMILVAALDEMNIRGEQIIAALNYCKSFPMLIEAILVGDPLMVHELNEIFSKKEGITPMAVRYGGRARRVNLTFP